MYNMDIAVPLEVQVKRSPTLPDGTSTNSVVVTPNNGAIFSDNGQIILDLPVGRGYLNPNSMYIRYRQTCSGMAGAGGTMIGIPLYTPFSQFQMLFNSQVVENISDYNIVMSDLVNLKMTAADKVGHSQNLGIGGTATNFSFNSVNGRLLGASPDVFSVSGPLPCLLSQSETYVPLFLLNACRIILNIDTIANMFNTTVNTPATFNISQFELCMDVVSFPAQVDAAYLSMVNQQGKIVLKSSSWMVSSQPLASGSSGTFSLPYSFRLASIKSVLLHASPAVATSATSNGKFDSIDITSNNGSFQIDIGGGTLYPPRPLSTLLNKSGLISELCLALFGNRNILSSSLGLTPATWNYTSASASTSYTATGMFIVGINSEKCSTSSAVLTGASTLLSPVVARIDINTATSQATQIRALVNFDALISIDVNTRQVDILQ
jgi:hypothetical protein